jgi:DNA-binding cell septation regulator SpoVG
MTTHKFSEITFRLNNETIQPYEPRIVAWASVVIDGVLKLHDLVVWRMEDGRFALRWPHMKTKRGRSYAVVHPINKDFAKHVEKVVLGALASMRESAEGGA